MKAKTKRAKKKEEKNEPGISKKLNEQFFWMAAVMVAAIGIFLFCYSVLMEAKKIEYQGLVFTKERFGEIPVYHYYYYFQGKDGLVKYNLFLRIDPRVNNVTVSGEIIFRENENVHLSINGTGLAECENSNIAIADLTRFLTENEINVSAGTPNAVEASLNKQKYFSCALYQNMKNDSVIEIKKGEKSEITKKDNCYTVSIANCEILEAIEKFKVQAVLDAKKIDIIAK